MDEVQRASQNARRRERYAADPEYRARVLGRSREQARLRYQQDAAFRDAKRAENRAYIKANPEKSRAAVDRYRAAHPDRVKANERRTTLRRWGLSEESYDALLDRQGGGCAICGGEPTNGPGGRLFAVDHDHSCCPDPRRSCGKCVRGLLCHRCNVGLAHFNDSPEQLEVAAAYLRSFD